MNEILAGLREAKDADATGLIELIGGVYAEYPGCLLDLPGVDNDLTAIRTHLAAQGGRLWVLPDGDGLRACIGYAPTGDRVELKRLYVRNEARRRGIGAALTSMVLQVAAAIQATGVDLWSDTRFDDAHRHYERHGWTRQTRSRYLHDPSNTTEYHFTRDLAPAAPDATITWHSDNHEREDAMLVSHPWAWHLRGRSQTGSWQYRITTDERGLTRDVVVESAGRVLHLSSDGLGRWWRDGFRDPTLDGCTDVDIEVTPATNTLPIRRANGLGGVEVTAAWIRWPDLQVVRSNQRYTRLDATTWRYRSAGDPYDLRVDGHGLVQHYGNDVFVAE